MTTLALLIALGATSGVSSCPGGSCAPAYTYAYTAPSSTGGTCGGYTYASNYAPPVQAAPQPVYAVQAAPQPVYAPAQTYTPIAYAPAPQPVAMQAPAYYYSSAYAAPAAYGCANGQCYRR